jgi:hypothetical protein
MKETSRRRITVKSSLNAISTEEPVFVNVYRAQESIPESIPSAYVAWRVGTKSRVVGPASHSGNRFQVYKYGLCCEIG